MSESSLPPRRAGLRRTGSLGRGAPKRRARARVTVRDPDAAGAPVPQDLRDLVLARAGWCCDRCRLYLPGHQYSLQHRCARGAGGSAGAHTAANLVLLCGSATSRGCHNDVEQQRRALAYDTGFAIRGRVIRPEETPILRHWREWVIPTEMGWSPAPPLTVYGVDNPLPDLYCFTGRNTSSTHPREVPR